MRDTKIELRFYEDLFGARQRLHIKTNGSY